MAHMHQIETAVGKDDPFFWVRACCKSGASWSLVMTFVGMTSSYRLWVWMERDRIMPSG